jgi:hypothetical protein
MKQKLRALLYDNGSIFWNGMVYLWFLGWIGLSYLMWPHALVNHWAEPLYYLLSFLVFFVGPLLWLQCWLESPDNPQAPSQR